MFALKRINVLDYLRGILFLLLKLVKKTVIDRTEIWQVLEFCAGIIYLTGLV